MTGQKEGTRYREGVDGGGRGWQTFKKLGDRKNSRERVAKHSVGMRD